MNEEKTPTYVYALMTGVVRSGPGQTVVLNNGDVWLASDPFVAERPDLFSEFPPIVHNTQGVNAPERQPLRTMTRRPGVVGR